MKRVVSSSAWSVGLSLGLSFGSSFITSALALLVLLAAPVQAGEALSDAAAANWLQRMADASRKLPYEGIFILQQGDRIQTLRVENRPDGLHKDGRLVVLDGQPREVRCSGGESTTLATGPHGDRLEKRHSNRYFPDLLPEDAGELTNWYSVRLGETVRVGGQACRQVELAPRDQYRWGYVLCADLSTNLPLRAVMVNGKGQPLMQYSFVNIRQGTARPTAGKPPASRPAQTTKPTESGAVTFSHLPPGFSHVATTLRKLPNRDGEVEHWVFSDGLAHISLFVEPAPPSKAINIKGESPRGMINLLSRRVGDRQVTVLGEAPWPAVEFIAMGLSGK